MIRKYVKKIIDRYGVWRTVQAMLVCGISILMLTTAARLLIPIRLSYVDHEADTLLAGRPDENISLLPQQEDNATKNKRMDYRAGLFKPASGLRDQPLADKTIERIKGQLKLRCVMELNGEPAAYINAQGEGVKRYSIGSRSELFSVVDINVQTKSVDVMIVDHKVTLSL